MLREYLKQEDAVEILKKDHTGDTYSYNSKVFFLKGDDTIVLTSPTSTGPVLIESSIYQIRFVAEGKIFKCDVKLITIGIIGRDSVFTFELANKPEIAHNREMQRLHCEIPVTPMTAEGDFSIIALNDSKDSVIRDLSGGGIKLISNLRLRLRDIVEIPISLDGALSASLSVEVVNASLSRESVYEFSYGMIFVDIQKKHREAIIQYVNRKLYEESEAK